MFNNPSKVLAHSSAVATGNFVTAEYILNSDNSSRVNLFHRFCPHRMYPLAQPGQHTGEIVCKFHGFKWTDSGDPINNDRKIGCGNATVGRSGLVFKDFVEPAHKWVDILAGETGLVYSHSMSGASATGSWLWMMDIQADLLHIWNDGIHPTLAAATNLDDVIMDQGNGWALQYCSTGFWLVLYPFTFIEWSPGCLAINVATPNDSKHEFGFSWITQFYYDPSTSPDKRADFETLEDVFKEDVEAVETQRGGYYPLMKSINRLEDHCVHFGKWVTENRSV